MSDRPARTRSLATSIPWQLRRSRRRPVGGEGNPTRPGINWVRAWRTVAWLVLIGSMTGLVAPQALSRPVAAPGPYGSVQGDSRNNHQVGKDHDRVAYRFRATTTAAVTGVRVQQRGRGGDDSYSGGDGGTIRVSIQTDKAGKPSGTILSDLTFMPGNPAGDWEVWPLLTFRTPASLITGRIYHLVFDNVAADPTTNFISLNALFYWGSFSPRQPTLSDAFAVLVASPTVWVVQPSETPVLDLVYDNGIHDGMGYIGAMGQHYGSISGAADMVREHFTVSRGDRTVTSANVKVKRISGTGPLTISLERGDGTPIESVTIPADAIPLGQLPASDGDESKLGGNTWASAAFASPHLLADGETYSLRLSTLAGTQYVSVPVQEGTSKGLASFRFTDGDGQETTDAGSTWSSLYPYDDVDLQFYLR